VRRLHSSQHHYHLSHRGSIQYSDCGMLHRPALLHTALGGVGLINHIWDVVNDGEENSFPIMNLRICQMQRTKISPSHLLCTLREASQETVDGQTRCISIWCTLWRTEHFTASKLHSQHLLKISKFEFCSTVGYTARTPRTDIRCRYVYLASHRSRIVIHSMLHNTTADIDFFS
jgi:hypothetical protein